MQSRSGIRVNPPVMNWAEEFHFVAFPAFHGLCNKKAICNEIRRAATKFGQTKTV